MTSPGFIVIGPVTEIATIAIGKSIREIRRLKKTYGSGRWRKRKGIAPIRLSDGTVCRAEIHWYEAHAIGKRELKIKYLFDRS